MVEDKIVAALKWETGLSGRANSDNKKSAIAREAYPGRMLSYDSNHSLFYFAISSFGNNQCESHHSGPSESEQLRTGGLSHLLESGDFEEGCKCGKLSVLCMFEPNFDLMLVSGDNQHRPKRYPQMSPC